jgi:anhydro-N-acetylmuramic acid kinase
MAKPSSAGRLVRKLTSLASRDERLVVGLMSGTSADGIDAALVRCHGWGHWLEAELVDFVCVPYDPALAERLGHAAHANVAELARLNFDVGEAFAGAALTLLRKSGMRPGDVHLVGSHGQTVYHEPPEGKRRGATLQIGEGDVIARQTGVVTVSDFRTADVAAGGSGAPLIPLVDWLLFRKPDVAMLMLNIGGIANVTWVVEDLAGVRAFDTGPGNALCDEIARRASHGRLRYDEDGAGAVRGTPRPEAVARFLARQYFAAPPPKSTGKELFGRDAARELAELVHGDKGREWLNGSDTLTESDVDDLQATAAAVTARSVRDAVRFLPVKPEIAEVVVSGGGVKNKAMMTMLRELLAPVDVRSLTDLGIDPDAKEAMGFAILANETLGGGPGNVPAATGAKAGAVLGKISVGL